MNGLFTDTFEQSFEATIHGNKYELFVEGSCTLSAPEPMTRDYPGCPEEVELCLEKATLYWGNFGLEVTEGRLFDRLYDEVQESVELMELVMHDLHSQHDEDIR